ncbi:undecaprenyl-phosphate glucose phosphotransferase [Bordetella genomosp. 9]|uniref:Undecaprenyl-phosphate glucose phosphotransferase n=1 Tax=Bordetella genomosp. 9 TaxID=1416803 RepID=A0A1W6Z639_9BORD|nr:undecaprenyl-phosphate glucose phosphotransferase [Bordetella genomosp. 9]ARP88756.1 undecaprenyl-phosphate glucose phosphotransferase [Bordetella genomosp. 9]ARP92753.1 undecaprenyl-phosphate glucose phosphotransferase [Bordetella genomosp. 9]
MNTSSVNVSGRLADTSVLYRLTDAAIVAAVGLAATSWLDARQGPDIAPIHAMLVYLCSFGTMAVFPAFRLYTSWRGRSLFDLSIRSLAAWTVVFAMAILISFLNHQVGAISRLWALVWYGGTAGGLIGVRLVVHGILREARDRGLDRKRVVMIGFGTLGHDLWRRAAAARSSGYEIAGIYVNTKEHLPAQAHHLNSLSELSPFIRKHEIREVWIALPVESSQLVREAIYHLRHDPIDVRWIPDVMSVRLLGHRVDEFLGVPAIELNSLPAAGIRGMAKEVFDRVFAFCVLVGLSPLLLAIAAAIKLTSRGPVLFKQARLGVDGKVFQVYKFRSMTVHKERDGVVTQATRNDSRVTRIGAFLRRTSLDELPQFINVLRGEMSVVGPRPHALEHNEQYKDVVARYMMRHRVKPGITGWAQVNGFRGQTDTVHKMRDRVEFDLYYIQNWTFLMDLRIIAKTALSGWTGKNVF